MKANRKFVEDKTANINMIVMGLLIMVISVLAIAIIYPILASVDTDTIDATLQSMLSTDVTNRTNITPAGNASASVLGTTGTVLGLNPLAALVAVAAGIISLLLGAFLVGGVGKTKL